MALFELLQPETCEAITGGGVLTRKPSDAYGFGDNATNYGQYKNNYSGPEAPNNPSSWYGLPGEPTNYGQFVKAQN